MKKQSNLLQLKQELNSQRKFSGTRISNQNEFFSQQNIKCQEIQKSLHDQRNNQNSNNNYKSKKRKRLEVFSLDAAKTSHNGEIKKRKLNTGITPSVSAPAKSQRDFAQTITPGTKKPTLEADDKRKRKTYFVGTTGVQNNKNQEIVAG